jgi:UDP-N-acetylmuramoyl-L-alanyl-D-glutamate--2,6-diaminopimelate ligase
VPAAPTPAGPLSSRPERVEAVALADLASAAVATQHSAARGAVGGVTGVTVDSRAVRPGDLYAALPGARVHGAQFCAQAAAAGAVAVLTDPPGLAAAKATGLPVLVAEEPRRRLGRVSAVVYGYPAEALTLVGITGTSGKTTTAHLAEAAAAACGLTAARIGTTGTAVDGQPVPSHLTTPEAPDLQALFAVMRERGVDVCAMEVSSHSLVLGRVDEVVFDVAAFTNLGRDHLDFHADEEAYFAAKATLFTTEHARRAVVNADDEHGRRLAAQAGVPVRTFSASGAAADWRGEALRTSKDGTAFDVVAPDGSRHPAHVALPGSFNVANALTAISALVEAGLPLEPVIAGIAGQVAVDGRMERVEAGQEFLVVVDYAHKPDALRAVLAQLRAVTPGRLVVVLGAGGDRDAGKRPLMGEVAARGADLVVVTDDNPRSEDPAAIRAALLAGACSVAGERATVVEQPGREDAIVTALSGAGEGDCVLIAGKGHEHGQEIDGASQPFDDREVARAALARLAGASRP